MGFVDLIPFLKGGCQAMLMESIGNRQMNNNNKFNPKGGDFYLDELTMKYMSQGRNNVFFTTEQISEEKNMPLVGKKSQSRSSIKAFNKKDTMISEGQLTYRMWNKDSETIVK